MDHYDIILTPDATADLFELRDYIAEVLLVPDTALSYVRAIREEISKLSEMPTSIKPIDDEPWHSYGVRKIIAKNFYVYFWINEETKRVFILNVIYEKRDQLKQLTKLKID